MKNNKHQILYKALVLSLAIIIIIFNNNKALSLNEITAEKIDLKAEDIEPAAVLPLSIESVTDLALKKFTRDTDCKNMIPTEAGQKLEKRRVYI